MFVNYDRWKVKPPQEPEPETFCNICGRPLYEGDAIYMIDDGICEECLQDNYRELI